MAVKSLTFYDKEFCNFNESNDVIKENIKRILMTRPGERVNNLTYGSRLQEYLFSSTMLVEDILSEIKNSIERCESRVKITKVELENIDGEKIEIGVYGIEKESGSVVDIGVTIS